MSGALTSAEARARFDAARDGELSEADREAFEAALADDAELRADYERHRAVLDAARELSHATPAVDLLAGVQHKLRARSAGRFYRDRFAERRGMPASVTALLVLSAVFVLVALCWLAYEVR